MTAAMLHRGPDDGGYASFPAAGSSDAAVLALGFRRLSILDLSPAGHQPMVHPETGDCLIFNGEIYNFLDLRRRLELAGSRFSGTSDTEVLLHALAHWGEAALEQIEGMYAMAFYDSRRRSVLLARDPLGIKPLYMARSGGHVVFGSEVRTVLASGLVAADVDPAGLAGMLAYGAVQGTHTLFSAIKTFPAGHWQWLGSESKRFWAFPPVDRLVYVEAAVERVRTLVHRSVQRHLVADVPVGVFLSAGIDSSIIAACVADSRRDVTAFTVGIGAEYPQDEAAISAETARTLGIPHRIVRVAPEELAPAWQAWITAMDSPSIDGFNTFLVSRSVVEHGIKVALSGLGADELFGGYAVFRTAPRLWRITRALSFIPTAVRLAAVEGVARAVVGLGAAEKLADIVGGDASLQSIALGLRRVLSNRRVAAAGFPASTIGLGRDYLEAAKDGTSGDEDAFVQIARTEVSHYMRDTLLRDTDGNSMRHSLEVRVPFLDLPLVNYALGLPSTLQAMRNGVGKQLLRVAFADRLSMGVTHRPKTGFTLPIGDWMRGQMREYCEHALDTLASAPGINAAETRRTWQEYQARPGSMHWSRPLSLVILGAYLDGLRPSGL